MLIIGIIGSAILNSLAPRKFYEINDHSNDN